jgi:TldD protein
MVARPLLLQRAGRHGDAEVAEPRSIADRAALLHRADAAARHGARVDRVTASLADVEEEILIATSEGRLVSDTRTLCRMSLDVIVNDPAGKRRTGSAGGGSRRGLSHFDAVRTPEQIGAEAVRMAIAQLGARAAPAGERVVVVGPGASGVLLHESVGHGLEADFARKRTSLYAGRLGQRVASELVTVVDDGTLPLARGSLNVDDEGTPTSRTVLIERGVLKAYLTDTENARLLGVEETGNGRRQSFRHPPLPRMTNTMLLSGTDDPESVVREVKSGLYAKSFGGGQVDISSGSFVFEVREGYLIEDGRLTAPIRGASLVGNGPDVLNKVTRVAGDAAFDDGAYTCGKAGQSVPVTVGMPTVRLDGITVGGTGE